ncbi:hypothetical protein BSKO_06186 [Bryopsis sp. KO-2023]|nr:hypothetical protein BSKO_06186 [Bryopsis sp. KO-2023]
MGPRAAQAQASRNMRLTVIVAGVTVVIHVIIYWQSLLLTQVPGFMLHPPGFEQRLYEGITDIETQLDAVVERVGGGGCAAKDSLEDIRAGLGRLLEEWNRSGKLLRGSSGEASSLNPQDSFRGDAVFASSEVEEKVSALIKNSEEAVHLGLQDRPKINVLIGVITGFNDPGIRIGTTSEKYDYKKRRKALRDTWFPTKEERNRLENSKGTVVRFIVGHSTDWIEERAMDKEESLYQDFIRLPITESYTGLTNKTKMFITTAAALYDADWYMKVDDDVYLMVERVLLAAKQWAKMGAGYIGCMKHGPVLQNEGNRWYEPQHLLIGKEYYLHAYGSIYVLAKRTVENVVVKNFHDLRSLASEDTTVGAWMLGHNVVHFEDMRLCTSRCSPSAVALLRNECAGLCNPLKDLYSAYGSRSCRFPTVEPLPYMQSYFGHDHFDKMHV